MNWNELKAGWKVRLEGAVRWLGAVALRAGRDTLRRVLDEEIRPKVMEEVTRKLTKNGRAALVSSSGVIIDAVIAEIRKRI